MNKIIIGASIIVVCFFTACANNDEVSDLSFAPIDSSKSTIIPPDSEGLAKPDSTLTGGGQATLSPLAQPTITPATLTTTAVGKNPPHGQPNHRCDIAVGAPLNSVATKPAATSIPANTTIVPTATAAQKTAVKTVTPAGMNPKHGEAGHRCDIAVGAPLNSPVIKPATPALAPVIVPAKKDSGS
ncbi:MAG: hypothetical protein WKI04_04850 [Ferruginibacter sp.]